jgi:hypothetical protein
MPASGNAPDYKAFRRTCCCCVPSRVGVIFFSFLGLFGGSAVTAVGILNIIRHTGSRASNIIQVVSYLLLAIVSIIGLIGAITRRIGCVKAFLVVLILHLFASIGTGAYAMLLTFRESPRFLSDCEGSSQDPSQDPTVAPTAQDPTLVQNCKQAITILKVFVIMVYIGAWLVQIWASVVVFKFMRQLDDEDKAKKALKASETW